MKHREHESFGRLISMLYRRRDAYLNRELKPYNIGPGQMRILLHLHRAL